MIGQHKRGRPENRYSVRLRQLNAVEHLTRRERGHPAEWLVEFVRHDPDSLSGFAEAAMFFLVLEYRLLIPDPIPFEPVPRAKHHPRQAAALFLPLRRLAPAPPTSKNY